MKSKLNDAELIAEAYSNVEPLEEGLGALAGGIGRAAMGAGRAIKKAATSDTTKKVLRGAGNLAKDVAVETGKVAAEVGGEGIKAAGKAVGALADKAVDAADRGISKLAGNSEDGEHKKPDADGDGVPDWADKKPGKDDHAEDGEDAGPWPAADHDAPEGGISSRAMDELKAKVAKAKAEGGIDSSDAAQIMRSHEDAETGQQAGHPAGSGDLEARNARAHELKMAKATAGIEDAEHAAPIEVDMSQNPAPESLEVSADVDVEEEPSVAIVAPSIQPSVEEPMMNHQDRSEMEMAKAELYKLEKYSFKLGQMLDHLPALEGWTASKITKAADYLSSVYHKLDYDLHGDENGIKSEDHEGH